VALCASSVFLCETLTFVTQSGTEIHRVTQRHVVNMNVSGRT